MGAQKEKRTFPALRENCLRNWGDTVQRCDTSRGNDSPQSAGTAPRHKRRALSSSIGNKAGKFNKYWELREIVDLLDVNREQGHLDSSQVSGAGDNIACGMAELETARTKVGLRGKMTLWKKCFSEDVLKCPPQASRQLLVTLIINTVLRCHSWKGT